MKRQWSVIFFSIWMAAESMWGSLMLPILGDGCIVPAETEKAMQAWAVGMEAPNPAGELHMKTDSILGEYTTSFATSSPSRKKNIKNGAMKLDGITLLPGETFSCYDVLAPFNAANGYETAGAYQNGRIVSSVGGGVCQISSTLYNAVLGAELEIVERHAHSMTVSYVDLARDAAIAGTYKDFCFTNDSRHPVAIKAMVYGDSVTFQILGIETRNKSVRTIKFETKIVSTVNPGDTVVTYDQSKPRGFTKMTQRAHKGYEAELYKVIYKNGQEVDRIKINSSIYTASPAYITVGTGG